VYPNQNKKIVFLKIPLHPLFLRGNTSSPPFGKREGGRDFQNAKVLPKIEFQVGNNG
jgi:hypothetical protein